MSLPIQPMNMEEEVSQGTNAAVIEGESPGSSVHYSQGYQHFYPIEYFNYIAENNSLPTHMTIPSPVNPIFDPVDPLTITPLMAAEAIVRANPTSSPCYQRLVQLQAQLGIHIPSIQPITSTIPTLRGVKVSDYLPSDKHSPVLCA